MSDDEADGGPEIRTPNCPACGAEPADATWMTAPGQAVCDSCPVVSWDMTKELEEDT